MSDLQFFGHVIDGEEVESLDGGSTSGTPGPERCGRRRPRADPRTPITVEDIAAQLDVGRAPVFRALQQLRSDGLLSPHPERGFTVTPITVGTAWAAYDARAAIKCGAIDQVGRSLTAEQLTRLRAAAGGLF